ncbi:MULTISPECIES: glutamine synthetase [unclassified Mesorhizobium]|uniref:glutamine synthetase n=1 Tax=unclassified Mesorhizobium TaxID=325217 RepID=UPI000FD42A15|nr:MULTISPECIES: glutamine synthetase [unclassified Mesorhizobium]RVB73581.1 glutamine synthetase [Mesorhizobium sp. M6A.T.Cr.TU.014.01.1.1]RWP98434.1 MAG: glutamine synthetase [Mesorhizobium sp.]RWQ00613.1 MAG: glutamine synthetase [Mesorhizobium sp.]
MTSTVEPLVAVVTTDLSAITRGRSVVESKLQKIAATGVGWLQANLSLTPFNSIVDPNPWGSSGDVRLVPDLNARFRTVLTGSATAFDMVAGNIVELDGSPWVGCTRTMLIDALAELKAATGLSVVAAFEHEFHIADADFAPAHSMSFAALRRADPFAPNLMAALEEAGVAPEVVIAEFGTDQFEVTHEPTDALAAADRAVAIREITREVARSAGWRASFTPKAAPDAVGNGVHIHFSFVDAAGKPATYDPARPGGLSSQAGAFCAGVLRHLPGITAMTAASVSSYYRLKPHSWSSSYTWLADRDREASLRICPTVTIGGRDPARQYNIEYRAADATGNPYLSLAAIVRAGLEGLKAKLPTPPLVTGDPTLMSETERKKLGLVRLPETLPAALDALATDSTVTGWFAPVFVETFVGLKRHETERLAGLDPVAVCDLYRTLY